MTTHENNKPNVLMDFLARNSWALIIVISSVIGQWAVFSTRLDNIEERVDRQGGAISALQEGLNQNKSDVAALNQKVDSVSENVTYIRSRIDQVLRNQQ